jgi:hypothetical protein
MQWTKKHHNEERRPLAIHAETMQGIQPGPLYNQDLESDAVVLPLKETAVSRSGGSP